jgi:hypothetical protein
MTGWLRRTIVAALFAVGLAQPAGAAVNDPLFDQILQRYVTTDSAGLNRFNYAGLRASAADRATLDTYIAGLESTRVSGLSRDAQFAFWANLYNATTIRLIVQRNPRSSIRDIKPTPVSLGPWKMTAATVEGRALSWDNIEHDILRVQWSDPRVHYAVNCASIGCPNIPRRAWRAATLNADLDAAARAYVNSPRGMRVEPDGRITISSIYVWFKKDFGNNDAGIINHLRRYATGPRLAALTPTVRIKGNTYDWNLNGR